MQFTLVKVGAAEDAAEGGEEESPENFEKDLCVDNEAAEGGEDDDEAAEGGEEEITENFVKDLCVDDDSSDEAACTPLTKAALTQY